MRRSGSSQALCRWTMILAVWKVTAGAFRCADSRVAVSRHYFRGLATTAGADKEQPTWANWALLISSWSDGVAQSSEAQRFLKQGLAISMLAEQQRRAESNVESSVIQSPCCGPNLEALQSMESLDQAIETIQKYPDQIDSILNQHLAGRSTDLRFLYIPTAMYALRPESDNTPGKQRQRARADGKKRRNEIARTLGGLFDQSSVGVTVVTLDLDDGSIKQPEGFGGGAKSNLPKDGIQALTAWSPHFVYIDGGNTFWLHHCLTKGKWEEALIAAICAENRAVYCGKSAGAIVAGALVETACWKGWDDPRVVPGMERYEDWKGVKGLDLVGGRSFFPHMEDQWETLVEEKRADIAEHEVVCLRDDQVLCVRGFKRQTKLSSGLVQNNAV